MGRKEGMVGSVEGKAEIEVIVREEMGRERGGEGVVASFGANGEVGEIKRGRQRKRGREEKGLGGRMGGGGVVEFIYSYFST